MWDKICTFFKDLFTGLNGRILQYLDSLFSWLDAFWEGLKQAIVDCITSVGEGFVSLVSGCFDALWNALPDFNRFIPSLPDGVSRWIQVAELFVPLHLGWNLLVICVGVYTAYLVAKYTFRLIELVWP